VRLGQAALSALGIGPEAEEEPAAEAEDEAIREPFDLAGEDHSIFAGPGGALLVASNGAHPVSDLDELVSLHGEYTSLPLDATTTERRRIIRAMIALIRANPALLAELADEGLGDPPNLGDVRPHRSQTPRFQPPSGNPAYAPLWEVLSEHVIPRSFVDALFAAFSLGGVTSGEYGGMHTILIYKGAAGKKTNLTGGDNTVYQELQGAATAIMGEVGATTPADRARAFDLAKGTVIGLFEAYATNALDRTYEAIVVEHAEPNGASTNGDIRGTPAAPARAKVDDAYGRQAADAANMLGRRLA
jgi:hypothetical protein